MQPQVDLRGTPKVPFGYVYLERTRVGFDPTGIWATRPEHNWPRPTEAEFMEALAVLSYCPWGERIKGVTEYINVVEAEHAE